MQLLKLNILNKISGVLNIQMTLMPCLIRKSITIEFKCGAVWQCDKRVTFNPIDQNSNNLT